MYHAIAGPTTVISSSVVTFVLALITIFRYRYIFSTYKIQEAATLKTDVMLFCHAIINLIFQLGLTSYYAITIIAVTAELPHLQVFAISYFNYMCDAASLVNPIALLAVCASVRKDYIRFWIPKRGKNVSVIITFSHNLPGK